MDLPRDRYDFTPATPIRQVHLVGCYVQCTKCKALVPMSGVGLRVMADGALRNQPRCGPCRSK